MQFCGSSENEINSKDERQQHHIHYRVEEQKTRALSFQTDSDTVSERKKTYFCPVDFTCYSYSPQKRLTLDIIDRLSTELWLIKAPPDFDPSSLSKKKIPLVECRNFETNEDGNKKFYNTFSIVKEVTGTDLLVPETPNDSKVCRRSFVGCINIRESCRDENVKSPLTIPTSQTIHIHEGLKQRFQPFGTAVVQPKVRKLLKGKNKSNICLANVKNREIKLTEQNSLLQKKNTEEMMASKKHSKRKPLQNTHLECIKKGKVDSKTFQSLSPQDPLLEQAKET